MTKVNVDGDILIKIRNIITDIINQYIHINKEIDNILEALDYELKQYYDEIIFLDAFFEKNIKNNLEKASVDILKIKDNLVGVEEILRRLYEEVCRYEEVDIGERENKRDIFRKSNYISKEELDDLYIDDIKSIYIMKKNLKKCNPKFSSGEEQWCNNCQRCVVAYRIRRREGFDVTAAPILNLKNDDIARNWSKVYKQVDIKYYADYRGEKTPKEKIIEYMENMEDGAIVQICGVWNRLSYGHTFIAEKVNGRVVFADSQNGEMGVENYLDRMKDESIQYARIDNIELSKDAIRCVEFL